VTGLPILGEIPIRRRRDKAKYLIDNPVHGDSFRRLRTNILTISQVPPLKSFLIASAEPSEGKSTVVANLARSMALAKLKTLLVDADLHCPKIHKIFDLPNKTGLSSIIAQKKTLSGAVQDTQFPEFHVLTSGPPHPHPAELLSSDQMSVVLEDMKEKYDLILFDTPAFLGVVDTAVLALAIDAVILVTRHRRANKPILQAMLQQLEQIGVIPKGIIVNRVKKPLPIEYQKYYQKYKPDQFKGEVSPDSDEGEITFQPESHDLVVQGIRLRKAIETALQSIIQWFKQVRTKPVNTRISRINETLHTESNDAVMHAVKKIIEQPPPTVETTTEIPHISNQEKDQFSKISGIGTTYEELLHTIGVMTYAQLAEQDPEDLEYWIAGSLTAERIRQERWIEQARVLSSPGDNDRF
jgi:capsular exopolysaccharide synthesis family protein